ncbi:MAG: hypothetical protein ACOCQM_05920 [Natronomonas sp.]
MRSALENPWSKRPTDLELQIVESVWRRYRRGETDTLGGGVAPATLATEIGTSRDVVSEVCVRLRDESTFVELTGADAETGHIRRSFAPAALADGGGA